MRSYQSPWAAGKQETSDRIKQFLRGLIRFSLLAEVRDARLNECSLAKDQLRPTPREATSHPGLLVNKRPDQTKQCLRSLSRFALLAAVRDARFNGGGLANHQSPPTPCRDRQLILSVYKRAAIPPILFPSLISHLLLQHHHSIITVFNHRSLTITIQSLQESTRSLHHEDLLYRPCSYASRPASYSRSSGRGRRARPFGEIFLCSASLDIPLTCYAVLKVLEPRCVKIGNACKYGDHGCCAGLTCKADIHITGEPGTCGKQN